MMRTIGMLLCVATLFSGCICPAPNHELSAREAEINAPGEQKFRLAYVMAQTKRLRPGMAKFQVAITLGAPAEMNGNEWIYINDLGVGCALKLHFQNNVYLRMEKVWR